MVSHESLRLRGVCNRPSDLILAKPRSKVAEIMVRGFDRHYEPQRPWKRESYRARVSNVDLRHGGNQTHTKLSEDEYRNKKYAKGWQTQVTVPEWDMEALCAAIA